MRKLERWRYSGILLLNLSLSMQAFSWDQGSTSKLSSTVTFDQIWTSTNLLSVNRSVIWQPSQGTALFSGGHSDLVTERLKINGHEKPEKVRNMAVSMADGDR